MGRWRPSKAVEVQAPVLLLVAAFAGIVLSCYLIDKYVMPRAIRKQYWARYRGEKDAIV